MDYTGTINALLRAVGFKMAGLTMRLVQEKGVSSLDTYAIYRYALIPSAIWCLIFVRKEDLVFIINDTKLLVIFISIIILFNLWALLKSLVINTTSSMIFYTTLHSALTLPLFLAFGTLFNGDKPNIFSLTAILVLVAAILLKPTPHQKNSRPVLSKPFFVVAIIMLLNAVCSTVLDGISREALKEVHPTVFLGVYTFTTLGVCAIISALLIKNRDEETQAIKDNRRLVLLVPFLWFASSIPEAFAFAALPIYTVVSLGAITFSMDTLSDVIHKRISFNLQTLGFIGLVFTGIFLTVLSV